MRYLLLSLGRDIQADENEKYKFIIGIAEGKLSFEEIKKWIVHKMIKDK